MINHLKYFIVFFVLFCTIFIGSVFATFTYSQGVPTAIDGNILTTLEEFKYSCVAEGTLITLANGSRKPVEDLTNDDNILVWNMFTGEFDSSPLLFLESDPIANYEIIKLNFSDGTSVEIIDEHAFWDFDLKEYVFIRNNNTEYINHWFKKQDLDTNGNLIWTKVQLVSIDTYHKTTTAWGPVTYSHLCLYVNGLLSMPGATDGLINMFEVDTNLLKYDDQKMQQDIQTYGLCTYSEFNEIVEIPEEMFYAFNGQYIKVSIGKGLIDIESLRKRIARYVNFFK